MCKEKNNLVFEINTGTHFSAGRIQLTSLTYLMRDPIRIYKDDERGVDAMISDDLIPLDSIQEPGRYRVAFPYFAAAPIKHPVSTR